MGVVFELLAQLARALADLRGGFAVALAAPGARAHGIASRTAGSSSACRSKRASASMLGRSVRSKWIGVIAIRPAATAARSVPGTSWKPGSEP